MEIEEEEEESSRERDQEIEQLIRTQSRHF